jgi:hypothetical protein
VLSVFIADVAELARQQAMQILTASLSRETATRRARGALHRRGIARSPARPPSRRAGAGAVGLRSAEDIDRASPALPDETRANPGLRAEELGRTPGAPTRDLSQPLERFLSQTR